MDRLNYFSPYQSKEGYHEDQLTRAFMVLLRYSETLANLFLTQCKDELLKLDLILPTDYMLAGKEWLFATQKANPVIETKLLLSVLLTDSHFINQENVERSERGARYDGIITIGDELTIIIENKPVSGNVWLGQLNPGIDGLSDNTKVIERSVTVPWKLIITNLNNVIKEGAINRQEMLLVEDFLSFIDDNYPILNPYDKFGLCKNNTTLLERRIKNILERIAIDKHSVQYHRGWAYKIEVGLSQLRMIGLALGRENNRWWLELSLMAGNTVGQSRHLYKLLHYDKLDGLNEMYLRTDFHLSFMSSNLIYFESPDAMKYVEYWKKHIDDIGQYDVNDIYSYLQELDENNIIIFDAKKRRQYEERVYGKKINVCPGIGLIWEMEDETAICYDDEGRLEQTIASQIQFGLDILGVQADTIKSIIEEIPLS